jgi:uncharacterized protein (TIGR03435 family)
MKLDALVKLAYTAAEPIVNSNGIAEAQPVRGGPSWTHSDFYSIDAEMEDAVANGPAPNASTAKKLITGPMLRALLEDRFQLKTHRDAEEVPMYALTVAKDGLKLKPMEHGCTPRDPATPLSPFDLTGFKPLCNTIISGRSGSDRTLDVVGSVSAFASALSGRLDRHVIDRTGVTGTFSIHLVYAPDENTPERFVGGVPAENAADLPGAPSIFTALAQMGLKLLPEKGPHGYIVIDQAERPSPN